MRAGVALQTARAALTIAAGILLTAAVQGEIRAAESPVPAMVDGDGMAGKPGVNGPGGPSGAAAPTAREIDGNPALELQFEGCGPWSNGVSTDQVATAPQLQLEAARRSRKRGHDYVAVEQYFRLTRAYPDSPQAVAGLLESSDLLLDLGFPSKAAFCMNQVLRRRPSGSLASYGVDLEESADGASAPPRDLAQAISSLEASIGLTLIEADRLGYKDHTSHLYNFWPFSLFHSPEDRNPFYNGAPRMFDRYFHLDLSRQFQNTQWIPGESSLRPYITYAFDADFYASAHLREMVAYDPLSYHAFSGYFHLGRLQLSRDYYSDAIAEFRHIEIDPAQVRANRNYPPDTVEIAAFSDMYRAWAMLLLTPEPYKDLAGDEKARNVLASADDILHSSALLQLEPVVDALQRQLDQRLAVRYLRMASFYENNGFPAAADRMKEYLRNDAPRTSEAASTLALSPWQDLPPARTGVGAASVQNMAFPAIAP